MKGYYEAKPRRRPEGKFISSAREVDAARGRRKRAGKIKKIGSVYDDELENRETRDSGRKFENFSFRARLFALSLASAGVCTFLLDYRRN